MREDGKIVITRDGEKIKGDEYMFLKMDKDNVDIGIAGNDVPNTLSMLATLVCSASRELGITSQEMMEILSGATKHLDMIRGDSLERELALVRELGLKIDTKEGDVEEMKLSDIMNAPNCPDVIKNTTEKVFGEMEEGRRGLIAVRDESMDGAGAIIIVTVEENNFSFSLPQIFCYHSVTDLGLEIEGDKATITCKSSSLPEDENLKFKFRVSCEMTLEEV